VSFSKSNFENVNCFTLTKGQLKETNPFLNLDMSRCQSSENHVNKLTFLLHHACDLSLFFKKKATFKKKQKLLENNKKIKIFWPIFDRF